MSELFLALQLLLKNPSYSATQPNTVVIAQPSATTWPTTHHHISQAFSAGHTGTDFDSHFNEPVIAAASGVVVKITHDGPYGEMIAVIHPQFTEPTVTRYAHLNTISVTVGDTVNQGEQIGTVGTSGNTTGPHIHFEVWQNGVAVDPMDWL